MTPRGSIKQNGSPCGEQKVVLTALPTSRMQRKGVAREMETGEDEEVYVLLGNPSSTVFTLLTDSESASREGCKM